MAFTIQQIIDEIGGELKGDGQHEIKSMGTLASAQSDQMSFLSNNKYAGDLKNCKAGCVILSEIDSSLFEGNVIVHQNPYLAFAKAAQLLDSTPVQTNGIHPSAQISSSAKIGEQVSIGANAVVKDDVQIADGVTIGPGTTVGEGAILDEGVNLRANVTIYHRVHLEKNVSVHSGTVIGSDGFGYANDRGNWVKIPQTGGVIVGEGTEIGANTCIDRGALDDTIIGKNCIIDNLVQIAHNVIVGDHSCICGGTGIAGSTELGKYVVIAGQCAINGHIKICDKVQITGFSMITKSITEPGVYSSGIPATGTREWQRNTVKLRNIDKLYDRVKALENKQD